MGKKRLNIAMNPDAARHAALVFIAVFGGGAAYFATYIAVIRKIPGPWFGGYYSPIGAVPVFAALVVVVPVLLTW